MAFQSQTPQQRRERYLRLAVRAREMAEKYPAGDMRDSLLAIGKSWESLAGEIPLRDQRKPISQITLYHRVEAWLRRNTGQCVCDTCIAKGLDDAPRANVCNATNRLRNSEAGFSKYRARCEKCGSESMVTWASPDFV